MAESKVDSTNPVGPYTQLLIEIGSKPAAKSRDTLKLPNTSKTGSVTNYQVDGSSRLYPNLALLHGQQSSPTTPVKPVMATHQPVIDVKPSVDKDLSDYDAVEDLDSILEDKNNRHKVVKTGQIGISVAPIAFEHYLKEVDTAVKWIGPIPEFLEVKLDDIVKYFNFVHQNVFTLHKTKYLMQVVGITNRGTHFLGKAKENHAVLVIFTQDKTIVFDCDDNKYERAMYYPTETIQFRAFSEWRILDFNNCVRHAIATGVLIATALTKQRRYCYDWEALRKELKPYTTSIKKFFDFYEKEQENQVSAYKLKQSNQGGIVLQVLKK